MGVKHLPLIARAPDRRRARRRRAGGGGRARHAPGPAHGHRARSPTSPSARREAGVAAAGDHGRRPGRRAARHARLARARGRCTAQVVAVTRARAQASGLAARLRDARRRGASRRPRSASSRGAVRRCRRSADYALVCLTSPNGARAALRRARRGGSTPARSPARRSPRSARAPPRALRGTASAPTWCPSASSPRRSSRRWPSDAASRAGACSSRAPPRRATCCPTRCASAAPRSTSSRSTRRSPSRSTTDAAARRCARADYVTFTSSSTVRFFLDGGGEPCPTARGSSRSARSRARRLRELGLEVHVEAERHDIDGPGRRAAWRMRRAPSARDRHPADRLRARRRLRRRLPRRHPRHRTRTRAIVDITHGIPRYDVRQGALVLRNTLPFMPVGVHVAVVDPQVGTERRAVALRCADGRILVGPDNGLLSLAWERCGGVDAGGGHHALARTGSSRSRRPSTAATSSRRSPPTSRAGAELADAGDPLDPAELAAWSSCRSRAARATRWSAHVLVVDRFGNVALDVDHDDLAGTGLTLGSRSRSRSARRALPRHLRADLRRRAARRAARLRGRLPHARRRDQPRRRRGHARRCGRTPRCALRPR